MSDNHIFSQWQPFNSFLPIFNMPGYTSITYSSRTPFNICIFHLLLKKATVVAETSDNHSFSQWQPFNSFPFLPIFNMPGYTPNIFNYLKPNVIYWRSNNSVSSTKVFLKLPLICKFWREKERHVETKSILSFLSPFFLLSRKTNRKLIMIEAYPKFILRILQKVCLPIDFRKAWRLTDLREFTMWIFLKCFSLVLKTGTVYSGHKNHQVVQLDSGLLYLFSIIGVWTRCACQSCSVAEIRQRLANQTELILNRAGVYLVL